MRRYVCAAVALLCCACACAGARVCSGGGPALEQLVRRNYSEGREGAWGCAGLRQRDRSAAAAFRFDSPGLELISCVAAEEAGADFADGDVYFLLLSGSADSPPRYKCKFCASRWHVARHDPLEQRPLMQCAFSARPELELGAHPADDGVVAVRLDGVRCHTAFRKGCDRGYAWCHGACCRAEALFYYPQLQRPIGKGRLLTSKSAGPRESPLVRLLMKPAQAAGSDC